MFTIGSRTVKTAIGAMIALSIAQLLALDNASTAAVITLLSVQSTKRKSVSIAWRRFAACLLGMGLAVLLFEGSAYTPIVVGVLLLIYIPLMAKMGLQDGIVPGFVIVMQLYISQHITSELLVNQILIFSIGIMVALLFNLYMPSVEGDMARLAKETDENLQFTFLQLARFIRKKERVWNDEFFLKTQRTIHEGMNLARRSDENSFFRRDTFYLSYFRKRQQQFLIIERMIPLIINMPTTFEQNGMVADFVEELGTDISQSQLLLGKLQNLRSDFEHMELPKTREEFETRGGLLVFINELEQFIELEE